MHTTICIDENLKQGATIELDLDQVPQIGSHLCFFFALQDKQGRWEAREGWYDEAARIDVEVLACDQYVTHRKVTQLIIQTRTEDHIDNSQLPLLQEFYTRLHYWEKAKELAISRYGSDLTQQHRDFVGAKNCRTIGDIAMLNISAFSKKEMPIARAIERVLTKNHGLTFCS